MGALLAPRPAASCPTPFVPACRRLLVLLEEAERVSLVLEDRRGAAHATYLRALVQDALGNAEQRNAAAASFGALVQPAGALE